MKALTIDDVVKALKKEQDKGHGDYVVFVTDDEEANGYHALWFSGNTPEDMTDNQRQWMEDANHDLDIVGRGRKSKAYYIG